MKAAKVSVYVNAQLIDTKRSYNAAYVAVMKYVKEQLADGEKATVSEMDCTYQTFTHNNGSISKLKVARSYVWRVTGTDKKFIVREIWENSENGGIGVRTP